MRVLFAAHQFFPEHYAGVETVTLSLAQEFKARGHEPYVLAPKRSIPVNDIEPGEVEDYEFGGIPVRRVGRPKEGISRPYSLDYENEVMAGRTREYMRKVEPDIVHAEHFQGLSASVIPAIKEFVVPLVYTATDFWTFCPVVDLRRHDGVMCRGPEISHCTRCIASRYPGTRMKQAVDLTPPAAIKVAGALPLAAPGEGSQGASRTHKGADGTGRPHYRLHLPHAGAIARQWHRSGKDRGFPLRHRHLGHTKGRRALLPAAPGRLCRNPGAAQGLRRTDPGLQRPPARTGRDPRHLR